jgi:hypothetical protein
VKEGKQQSSHKRIKPGLLTEQEQVSKSVSSSQTAKGPGTIAHQQFESQSTEPLVLVPVRQLLYGKLFQHDLPTSLPIFSKLVKLKGQLLAPPPLLFSAMQHMKPQQAGCHVFQVCSQTEHEIFLENHCNSKELTQLTSFAKWRALFILPRFKCRPLRFESSVIQQQHFHQKSKTFKPDAITMAFTG